MPKAEQPEKSPEDRIFEELTFIGDHILYIEKTLQEILRRLGGTPTEPPGGFSRF